VDEDVAGLKRGNLVLVVIDADDGVSDLGEADGGDQADVTRSNDCRFECFAHGLRQMVLLQCNADSLVDFSVEAKSNQDGAEDRSQTGAAEESEGYDLLP